MLWNTHMVAGVLATETYLYATNYELKVENIPMVILTLGVSAVFATIPDTDQQQSWAGKRLFPLSLVLSLLNVKHRGLTHSLLFTLLVWYILTLFPLPSLIITGAVVGYCSHWFVDMFNTTGIQLFYPLQMKLKFGVNIPVNSMWERVFQYGCGALVVVVGYFYANPLLTEVGIQPYLNSFFRLFSI